MSETAYERGYRVATEHAGTGGGGGSSPSSARASSSTRGVLFRQMGMLPIWAWMVIGLALALGVTYWRARKTSNTAGAPSTTAASSIPQFVNQTYVNPGPPVSNPEPPSDNDSDDHKVRGKPIVAPPGTKPPKIHVAAFKYTVKKGDTLLSLSQKFLGTTNRTVLAHANGLGTGAGLRTGQVITIPAHDSPPGSPPPRTSGSGGGESED